MKRHQLGTIAITTWALLFLIALLVASIVANVGLYNRWEAQKVKTTAAETNLATANDATRACNDSIAGLEKAAYSRGKKAAEARAAAQAKNAALARAGQHELQTPATVPGDDCRSARDRVARLLKERRPP